MRNLFSGNLAPLQLATAIILTAVQTIQSLYLLGSSAIWIVKGVLLITVGLIFGLAELLELLYVGFNKLHFILKYLIFAWAVFKVACWAKDALHEYIQQTI